MTAKEKYRILCRREDSMPLFSKAWWLDAVCGFKNWEVVILENNKEIVASFPYYIYPKFGFKFLVMPALTQTLGPWIKYPPGQKLTTRISYEKKILTDLLKGLPKFDYFNQNFNHLQTNWLPFFWEHFNQTTRYTYVLTDINDLDRVFCDFRENIRREIRKAERIVQVHSDLSIDKFYEVNQKTFTRQAKKIPYSLNFLRRLDAASSQESSRKFFFAVDENKNIHAAIYIVWDKSTAHYLMGGADPKYRNSGATSLLLWEAIKYASKFARSFNFEGSMIEPVERFFRAFGAEQVAYFKVTKIDSIILRALFAARSIIKC